MNAEILSQPKHTYPVFTYFPVREKLSQQRYARKQKQKQIPRRGSKIEMKNSKRKPKSFNDLQIHDKEIVQGTSKQSKQKISVKPSVLKFLRKVKEMKIIKNQLINSNKQPINTKETTSKPAKARVAKFLRKLKILKLEKSERGKPELFVEPKEVKDNSREPTEIEIFNPFIIPLQHFDFEF